MKLYYPFSTEADTPISINYYTGDQPIKSHMHSFHEMVLVLKGSCRFLYEDEESVLIPGDIYIIEPHRLHNYLLDGPFECYNLMYHSEQLGAQWDHILLDKSLMPPMPDAERTVVAGEKQEIRQANINRQNILHLTPEQTTPLTRIMESILEEQTQQQPGYEAVQLSLLELLMVYIKRAQCRQFAPEQLTLSDHPALVEQVLTYIESHLTEPIYFDEIAEQYHLSIGHFRRIFKQIVGLSPVEYVNRLRIVKSLSYLQEKGMAIADAAAAVGISDPNYYSRLFKKTIGFSPRYFKDYAPQNLGIDLMR